MKYPTVDAQYVALSKRLADPGYSDKHADEADFEAAVWDRLFTFMSDNGEDAAACCLTSHTQGRTGRSDKAWKAFLREECGPDVNVLGSDNRLDIVVKHPIEGSIGIEVKWLGDRGHAVKLTKGIGQAMLALACRSWTLVIIHCGSVQPEQRDKLRTIAKQICRGTKTSIIVVP
jgi:hypothetical protein